MMTPDQRYYFDLTGYLHLRGVLSPEELAPAQAAADRYINMPPEEWPPEFGADLERRDLTGYQHGFAFDKSLEILTPASDDLADPHGTHRPPAAPQRRHPRL